MCKVAGIIFLQIILLPIFSICAEDQLVFVNILFRHGDRTPIHPYPTDPYRNASYWSAGFGQLTNRGKRQHYELGQWLRKRYSGFLPEKYSLNDIYVRSTDVDRTLMSAESNLAGLYSPINSDVWNPDVDWQPIPVHTIPENIDSVLSAKKKCPKYEMDLANLLEDEKFTKINKKLEPLYEYISNYTGKTINTIQELEYFYNTLFIEDLYKFQLPNWTKNIFPDKLLPWAHLSFQIYCYTPELQRLKVGLLFKEITDHLVNKSTGTLDPDRKMWMYSAHDTTIANVLMALGAFEPHCPPYTSTIILELRHSSSGFYVSAFYKNSSEPQQISILGCGFKCPLEKVLKLLEPIMLTETQWEEECESSTGPLISTIATIAVVSCGVLLFLLVISLCIGAVCSKQNNHRNQFYQPLNDDIN